MHVRDLDPFDRADLCSEGQCSSRIVGVQVDLERARVADDEQRVAEPLEPAFELLDLQAFTLDDEDRAVAVPGLLQMNGLDADRRRVGRGFRQRLSRRTRGKPARDLEQARPARVDDAGFLQDREQLRSPCDCLLSTRDDAAQELGLRQRADLGLLAFLGHLADDGQHRPLDRTADGTVGGIARRAEGLRENGSVDLLVLGQHVGEPPDDLGEDDAGVPARAHQRRAAQLLGDGRLPTGARLLEGFDDGSDGQREVRPGVAVRHRVDVEVVDPAAVRLEARERRAGQLARAFDLQLSHGGHPRHGPRRRRPSNRSDARSRTRRAYEPSQPPLRGSGRIRRSH